MYDASSRQDVRKAEKASRQADLVTRETIISIMSTANGRQWIYQLLDVAAVFHTTFSPDPITMAFNEGQRNQGLQILNDVMRWCPDDYVLMMREANGRSSSIDAATAKRSSSEDNGRDVEDATDDSYPDDAHIGDTAYN